jgi:hypothetical protein
MLLQNLTGQGGIMRKRISDQTPTLHHGLKCLPPPQQFDPRIALAHDHPEWNRQVVPRRVAPGARKSDAHFIQNDILDVRHIVEFQLWIRSRL